MVGNGKVFEGKYSIDEPRMPSLCGEGKINRRRVDWMREEVFAMSGCGSAHSRSSKDAIDTVDMACIADSAVSPRVFFLCFLYLPERQTCQSGNSVLHRCTKDDLKFAVSAFQCWFFS